MHDTSEVYVFPETTRSGALSAFFIHPNVTVKESASRRFVCLPVFLLLCLTSLGLPGCDGGGVLRRGGGRALPLPLLHLGSLCLHCHAVRHSQGMETNCLQVSTFSACLPERPHFLTSLQLHALYEPASACVVHVNIRVQIYLREFKVAAN